MTRSRPGDGVLLGEAEVQRLLLAASERAPTGVRNRALVALLYCSGLRLAEALALRPGEVDLERSRVSVRGARARGAHLFPASRPYLETWLALRERLGLAARAPLFCTLAGEALEPAYVRAMLARLGRRAGLSKRVHAHLLRHSCAARLGRAGLDAEALAAQLGLGAVRSARRSMAGFGVALAGRVREVGEIAWSLAPEPGVVRAVVVVGERGPVVKSVKGGRGVVVKRWSPPEI